jgi:hypothetical protein
MRCLLTAKLDTAVGNQLFYSGRMPQVLQQILDDIKPEAMYFAPSGGRRTMFLIVDVADASQLVTKMEPLWLGANADIEIIPVMTREDLERGLQTVVPNLSKYAG